AREDEDPFDRRHLDDLQAERHRELARAARRRAAHVRVVLRQRALPIVEQRACPRLERNFVRRRIVGTAYHRPGPAIPVAHAVLEGTEIRRAVGESRRRVGGRRRVLRRRAGRRLSGGRGHAQEGRRQQPGRDGGRGDRSGAADRRSEGRAAHRVGSAATERSSSRERVNSRCPVLVSTTDCAFSERLPFLARIPSTETSSPIFIESRVQPWRISTTGEPISASHVATSPLASSATSMKKYACGFSHSIFTTTPVSATGFSLSYCAVKAWWARAEPVI